MRRKSQGRLIYEETFSSYTLKKCSYRQRILWIGIIVIADDYGFLKGDPLFLKGRLLPYDNISNVEDIEKDIGVLESLDLLERFIIKDTDKYIRIKNFEYYQQMHGVRRKPSSISPLYIKHVLKEEVVENKKESKPSMEYSQFEEDIVNRWNSFASKVKVLSSVIKVSGERRHHLKKRFGSKHFRENYKEAISKIERSKFLLGNNKRNWKVSFDFLIRNETNYLKILEGKYEDAPREGIARFMKND